jgi:hypothetical protein
MRMSSMPYEEAVAVFESAGGEVLDAPASDLPGGVVSRLYLVARTMP